MPFQSSYLMSADSMNKKTPSKLGVLGLWGKDKTNLLVKHHNHWQPKPG